MKINKNRVLELLREGWEMGMSSGHVWMQKKLCCGGQSHAVHLASFFSLKSSQQIVLLPRGKSDPFWLHRWGLKKPDAKQ